MSGAQCSEPGRDRRQINQTAAFLFFHSYGQHIPEIFIAEKRPLSWICSPDDVAGCGGDGGGAKIERPITRVALAGARRDEQPDGSGGRVDFRADLYFKSPAAGGR